MITKDNIKKIGFTPETIFIETNEGVIKSHPLTWFPTLEKATAEQRENYTISPFGVHWEALDMDLSFEGFFRYQKQDDNEIAQFFREFPEINMGKFAERIGISPAMLRHYACGTKKPSESRKKEIQQAISNIAERLSVYHLTA